MPKSNTTDTSMKVTKKIAPCDKPDKFGRCPDTDTLKKDGTNIAKLKDSAKPKEA